MKLILLYDAENVGGGINRAKSIHQHLIKQGFELETVLVCSKRKSELLEFDEYFSQFATTVCRPARSGKDSGDIIIATIAGFFLAKSLHERRIVGVALVSEDKKLALCLNEWITHSYKAYVVIKSQSSFAAYQAINPSITVIAYELLKRTRTIREPLFSYDLYPYIYSSSFPSSLDCLEVISVPRSLEPIPKFISLPVVSGELTIGASSECDIALEFWDDPRGSLYSPHAFIEVTRNNWIVRSAKGFRRTRSTKVNDVTIQASSGSISLKQGDVIQLGKFALRVRAIDLLDHRFPTSLSSLYDQIVFIERSLHNQVYQVLSEASTDWWERLVPLDVREGCLSRSSQAKSNEHPYRFLLLRELDSIVISHWTLFMESKINELWKSKTQFRKALSQLINARNRIMHPTREEPTEAEFSLIARLCIAL